VKGPRVIVRALLVEEGRLLVNRREGYLALFGGKVEKGESARDALARELEEELGLRVELGALAFVIENRYRTKHELGLYYRARRLSPLAPREDGLAPAWLPLAEVAGSKLLPPGLRRQLAQGIPDHPVEVL
jgi:ADP-ribose pyrophosphatase YjhB (NUDIX family)